MDRIDAMKVFVTAVEEGSLAGAARRLKRSPTAISRALGLLEQHVGVELLHRTTRSLKLSEAGQRYVEACRRVLVELEEADLIAGAERSSPRGVLTISAPPILGEEVLRPILDDFLLQHPSVSVRLLMLDRFVNLVDEGIDVALRIGNLADSTHISMRTGGDVRRVVVASSQYLSRNQSSTSLPTSPNIRSSPFPISDWSPGASRPPADLRLRERCTSLRATLSTAYGRAPHPRRRGWV